MRHSRRAVSLWWLIVLVPIMAGAAVRNKAPIAKNDAATTAVGTSVTIKVTANDRDRDGHIVRKTVDIVGAGPRHGRAVVKRRNGKVTYTPNPDFSGQDTFRYRVEDNGGALSNKARVQVTVGSPVANNDTAATAIDTPVVINVVANDTDTDGNLDPNSVAIATNPASGALVNHFDGTVTYTPSAGFFGTDAFAYTVRNAQGATSNVATVTVTVGPVADAGPDRNAVTGLPVILNGSASFDPDGNTLAFSWRFLSVPSASARTSADIVNPASSAASFTPDVGGNYELELTVTDGTLSDTDGVVITAAAPGLVPPNADAGSDIVVQLGQTVTLNGSASDDPDDLPNPTLTFQWTFVSTPTGSTLTNGNITGPITGTASFTPDVPGVYLLRLDVFDGADTDFDQVMVTVQPLPPPVITSLQQDSGPSQLDDYTNDTTPTLSGTAATAINAVTLYQNGTPVSLLSVISGAWSHTTGVLADGVYTFAATGKNAFGQESSPSDAKIVTVDATGPTKPSFVQNAGCFVSKDALENAPIDPVLVPAPDPDPDDDDAPEACIELGSSDGGKPDRAILHKCKEDDIPSDGICTKTGKATKPYRVRDGFTDGLLRMEITDDLPVGLYHYKFFVIDLAGNESCVATFVSDPEDKEDEDYGCDDSSELGEDYFRVE